MNIYARLTLVSLLTLCGCTTNPRPPDFGPIEYLTLEARNADHVPVSALKEEAIRQATAGCKQVHQEFKLIDGNSGPPPNPDTSERGLISQQYRDFNAHDYTSATILYRCLGEAAKS